MKYLSIQGFADAIGVSYPTARWIILNGEIPFVKIGKRVKIDPADVEAYLNDKKKA